MTVRCVKWLAKDNCCNEGTPLRAHSTTYKSRAQHLCVSDQRNRQLTGIHTVSDRKLSALISHQIILRCVFNVGTKTYKREHAARLYEQQKLF